MKVKAISIVAQRSNVGKTTLIKNLLKIFKKEGLNVAVIKHHHKEFDFDTDGKDSDIFTKNGASCVKMISPKKVITIENVEEEKSLSSVLSTLQEYDFVLVEGYKWENLDRIEVFRSNISSEIISKKEKLIAIVSDVSHNIGVDEFFLNDYENIAKKIKEYFKI